MRAARTFLLAAAVAAVAAGCGSVATPFPATVESPAIAPSMPTIEPASESAACPLQLGVAGLIPPNYPNASSQDWTAMYSSIHATGSLLGIYTNWSDSPSTQGQIPASVTTAYGLGPRYGFTPFVALGFQSETAGAGVTSTVAWSDPSVRARAVQVPVAIARQYKPRYLALGVEVNRAYESDPAGFDTFVAAYDEMYDAVKAVSKETLVFPIFQLEMTKGKAYLMGGSGTRAPEWSLLDRFSDRMDVAAFTTYPFLDAGAPSDLPSDYYSEIAEHTSRPIAFTEIGWPSAPLSSAPSSTYGGTPDEQASFVSRFFQLTAGLDVRAELWAFPDDLAPDYPNAAMTSVSLRDNRGAAKPALAVWQAKAEAPCGAPR